MICNSHPKPYELQVWKTFPHMQLVFSLSFVKLLWPFVRITSYAHDQDNVHVHSHAILLHLEDSKYIPYPSTNKTPRCAIFISLQSYHHSVWAIQKEIKDAYPKKVCQMPTRHVKKKRKDAYPKKVCHTPTRCVKKERERKTKYSPYQKSLQGIENSYKGVSSTIHQKYLHTCTSWSRLIFPLDPVFDLAKFEKQVCHYILHTYRSTKKKPLEVGWKKKGA